MSRVLTELCLGDESFELELDVGLWLPGADEVDEAAEVHHASALLHTHACTHHTRSHKTPNTQVSNAYIFPSMSRELQLTIALLAVPLLEALHQHADLHLAQLLLHTTQPKDGP